MFFEFGLGDMMETVGWVLVEDDSYYYTALGEAREACNYCFDIFSYYYC